MTGDSDTTFEIIGDAGLRNAREIASMLQKAISDNDSITVSLNTATSVDISIIQLLVAARKSALAAGKSISLRAQPNGVLRQALVKTGFVSADGRPLTSEGSFWTDTGQPQDAAA